MTPEIIECEQGTEEWHHARLGIPTASMFSTVLASGRGGGESKTRKTYLYKLAGEIITGQPMENYSNGYMERGHEVEAGARAAYAFEHDVAPTQVGFIRKGRTGCSPDSLVGADGMLEIKSKSPHLLIEVIEAGRFPPEHRAQVQGQLWIAEREWCDLYCFFPGMPSFQIRAHRDEAYIRDLSAAVDAFNDELDAIVERIRAYGAAA